MSKTSRKNRQFHVIGMMILFCGVVLLPIISENVSAGPITVYSPSSGQTLYHGQTYTISWSPYIVGDTVKIELYKGGSYSTITSSTENDGYYSWMVPSSLPVGSSYQIKITNASGADSGFSGSFIIDSRSITVTSPYSSSTWYQGGMYTISWTSDDAGNYVKIELYKSGSYHSTIASSVYTYSSYGSYTWAIPTSISPSSSYQIKVTSKSYSSTYDYSSYFSIDERTITITSPSEGDTWWKGESSTITWNSDVSGYVKIELYKNGSYYSRIISSVRNYGSYSWSIPSSLPIGSSYQIKITSITYSDIFDYSDYFSIDERFITINSPTAKDIWYKGEESTITWDSKNAGSYVKIELYWRNSFHSTIKSNTSNDGSYMWTIPSSLSTKSLYRIRIISMPDGVVYDYSSDFYIDERTISVVSPSGGEIWYLGETYSIRWSSENIGKFVDIELHEDGTYLSTIASDVSNNGYYSWTVPNSLNLSSEYSIKITSTSYEDVFEYSSGYIGIEKPLIQSWLGNILIIAGLIIVLTVLFVLFKMNIIKIPKLSKPSDDANKTLNAEDVKKEIKEVKISQEEYDNLWEEQ